MRGCEHGYQQKLGYGPRNLVFAGTKVQEQQKADAKQKARLSSIHEAQNFWSLPFLVNIQKTTEKRHAINGRLNHLNQL